MSKGLKWLTGLVLVLVILNVTLLATIWLKKERVDRQGIPGGGDARNYLVKALMLDNAQVKAFDSLRTGHFNRIDRYKNEMWQLKDQLFARLSQPAGTPVDTLARQIGVCQSRMDVETFNHFRALRMLLHPQQINLFNSVIQEVLYAPPPGMVPPPPGPHPGGRPGGSN